jgi:C1A family cysteine protease
MLTKILALFYLTAVSFAHDFTLCNSNNNDIGLNSLVLTPDPPVAGQNLKVSLSGNSKIDLSNPVAHLQFSVLGIPVSKLDIDICNNNNCPVKKNTNYNWNVEYPIPNDHPGQMEIDVTLDINDSNITEGCYKLKTNINLEKNLWETDKSTYLFKKWLEQHNKYYYTPQEYMKRLDIFNTNTLYILSHTHKSYQLAHNKLSDRSPEEYKQLLGFKYNASPNKIVSPIASLALPKEVDWREKGAVTPVKNQGQCGSCWSFSTTGALEGAYYIKTGKLVAFSEQELVSCDKVDQGCNGGLMDNAFKWIEKNDGLCGEDSYPYDSGNGQSSSCHTCNTVNGSDVVSYIDVSNTTVALATAVSKQPVSIAIEADKLSFQFYRSGVYKASCGTNLDHGVLLVGYGTEDGLDYWLVKNSWGPSWGDQGYIKILKEDDATDGGECGILLSASYPEL